MVSATPDREENSYSLPRQMLVEKKILTTELAGLLSNERAMTLLLKYLKATEVEVREGAREKKREWERKNDQAGKELLGETQKGLSQKSRIKQL